ALAHRHRRYGVGMISLKLRQEGRLVNDKGVERLYRQQQLQVRRRKRKKSPPEKPPDRIHCKASHAVLACWNCHFSLLYLLPLRYK
ncbi:IS3 family transposase, partial [Xanthomonas oryzae]|uniref:IS3 family transposase n=1 Tax=Xanthomonas oryzae TaxID=347 RepID=UPI003CCEF8D5